MTHPLTVRVSDELNEALETVAREARTSKSELVREYLSTAIRESDEPVPDHILTKVRREQIKSRNELTWQRIHFPSNVHERFKRAFEQGDLDGALGENAIEDLREIHVEDAKLLFEDQPERREGAVEFVNAVAEEAREATEASEFNRLDTEEMFSNYGGVEDGESRDRFVAVVEDAKRRLSSAMQPDPEAVARALSKEHGVSESVAQEAVEQVRDL